MTAEEIRSGQMRAYRTLFAAIIQQAVDDVKHADPCESAEATHWLMRSQGSAALFELLGIDPAWMRAELAKQPWLERGFRNEARLFNPLLAVSA